MYCRDCGAKLSLRFLENEGLIPYCERCGAFKFPYFPVAVSMTVVNRQENKILLARHTGEQDYKLFAGYIKKGETAEKAIPRELKEETKLTAIKWREDVQRAQYVFDPVDGEGMGMETAPQFWVYVRRETA